MCNYIRKNKCAITNEICPFMYYCTKRNIWKQATNMPEKCKVAEMKEVPKGYYKVLFEKHGKLYIAVENRTEVINNPFDNVPLYVKIYKTKTGIKLKKYEG